MFTLNNLCKETEDFVCYNLLLVSRDYYRQFCSELEKAILSLGVARSPDYIEVLEYKVSKNFGQKNAFSRIKFKNIYRSGHYTYDIVHQDKHRIALRLPLKKTSTSTTISPLDAETELAKILSQHIRNEINQEVYNNMLKALDPVTVAKQIINT